jgi:tripartite ATP-independent transporter DctM subunit
VNRFTATPDEAAPDVTDVDVTDVEVPPTQPRHRWWSAPVRQVDRCLAGLELAAPVLTALLLVSLVVVVLYEIAGREFTSGGGAPWTGEASSYLFIALTFIAASTSISRASQPRVHVLVERLPARLRDAVTLCADSMTLALYAYLCWFGVSLARFQWAQHGVALSFPVGIAVIPIPIGAALMFFARLRRMRVRSVVGVVGVLVTLAACWYLFEQLPGVLVSGSFFPLIIGILLVLFAGGVPVAEALLLSALVAYKLTDPFASDGQFVQQLFSGLNTFTYVAIPLFLLSGAIIAGTRMSERIVAMVRELVGWLPGSMGVVDVAASAVFADLSGSAVSDTVAVGTVMLPQLEADGYPKPYSVALQASAGTLGVLFPPAVSALLFASIANVSVSYMFAATLVPGILVTLSLMAYVSVTSARRGYGHRITFSVRRTAVTGAKALPGLGAIVIVLGGVFTGLFTSVEAGAVVALYSALIGIFDLARSRFRKAKQIVTDAAETVGRVCFVIAAALTFGWLVVANYGPQELVSALTGLAGHQILLLLALMLVLLAIHTLLDASATILVVVPILLPLLAAARINVVHFGVLVDVNSTVGLVLPPLGICLYLVSSIGGVKLEHAARAVVPFVGILLADMLVVLFVPGLTSFLPNLLGLQP